jgi:hypothetical protein
MAISISALRKAYEPRIKAILSKQIAPLFDQTCEVTGPVYFGPDEGVVDPSWWLMVKRTHGPRRTRRMDIIFEIARSSTYGDRPDRAGDGVAFGLRMVDADDTPHPWTARPHPASASRPTRPASTPTWSPSRGCPTRSCSPSRAG